MTAASFAELQDRDSFVGRHIGPGPGDIAAMLQTVGADTLDTLIEEAVPDVIRDTAPLPLGEPATEAEALLRISELASRNLVAGSLIGMGYHGTIVPPVIRRNVLEDPAWYTAYTPYQPEISQGRLEALLNFQTMVADLTGMEVANASLLDEATAAAEAMLLARKAGKSKSNRFLVSDRCHPQTIAVLQTRAGPLGIDLDIGEVTARKAFGAFGMLIQYPDTCGRIDDWRECVRAVRAGGGLATVAADLLALTLLAPPGEWGADIVVGSAQRFGVPMGFGGPHAAFFATRDRFKRQMPGRLVGVSVDAKGRQGLRLALQTREQHIRREKATSNICTAQVLLANMAGFYGVWHGPDGLQKIARRVHRLAGAFAEIATAAGHEIESGAFFDTVTVKAPGRAGEIVGAAMEFGLNLRFIDEDRFGVSFDESCDAGELSVLSEVMTGAAAEERIEAALDSAPDRLPAALARQSAFMTHPVFHRYRSETEMMRYLHRLAAKDLSLNRAMIPLGSCTMKLNAAAEMEPVSWPEFAGLHPFAPLDQAEGTLELIAELEDMLCAATGFDAVSLQPNAGSQGELAGLLVIRAWHESRGHTGRDICLIPSSAHGTNPASAVLAGLSVVVVGCDADGNIDIADLRAKAELAPGPARRPDGDLPLDPRRVRGRDRRDLRDRPGQRRPGLYGRRQPERLARHRAARRLRPRCRPYEPAQDFLHSPWRRRAGHRADRRQGPSRALPARPSGPSGMRRGAGDRAGLGGALGQRRHPADQLGLYLHDGRCRAQARDRGGDPQRQLYRFAPRGPFPGALHRTQRPGRP